MGSKILSTGYISSFCLELNLVLQAGIPLSEGIAMLGEDEPGREIRDMLDGMYSKMSEGEELNSAMRKAGVFPKYMVDMVELGERTGKLDTVLKALSEYYDRQEQMSRSIKNAIIYPAILLVMMLFVVLILITQVLPIFNDVFNQLGSTMSGAAAAMMSLGEGIRNNWIIILCVIAVITAALFIAARRGRGNGFALSRGISNAVASARFASAMSMTLQSGMDVDQSLDMAERLSSGPEIDDKIRLVRERMAAGESFSDAIGASGIFSSIYCRMIAVGFRTGAVDTVMDEIARRSDMEAQNDIESLIGKVEPTLVIIMSVIVGLILLSVMLPLMGVMSSIG